MTPRIMQLDFCVMLTHAWYTKIFIDQYFYNSEFIWCFSLEKTLIWCIYPRFLPKKGSNDPQNHTVRFFCNANTCMVHMKQLLINIFKIQNLYGAFSLEKQLICCIYPRFWSKKKVLMTPRVTQLDTLVILIHVQHPRSSY